MIQKFNTEDCEIEATLRAKTVVLENETKLTPEQNCGSIIRLQRDCRHSHVLG